MTIMYRGRYTGVEMPHLEGHVGLANDKVQEATNGEFFGALSYLKASQKTASFVIHVYSNTFDTSQYLQRSNVRGEGQRENFLERLGFTFCASCNILREERCYDKVVEEVGRDDFLVDTSQHMLRVQAINDAFRKFMANLQEIYNLMRKVDQMILEVGFELPWSDLELRPIVYEKGEKVYEKGQVYDFYTDIREITQQAKAEVFLIDAYPDEDVLNLYLEKIPSGIKIRILTNEPNKNNTKAYRNFANFVAVSKKFKMKPGVAFEVRESQDCHDRLFFVDDSCWVMGQSLKDAGKKPTYLVKIESQQLFRKVFEDLWNQGRTLV
jgi:hypothetical protein